MPIVAIAGALGSLAVVRCAYRTAVRVNRELEEARMARVAEAARAHDIPTCAVIPLPARTGRVSFIRTRHPESPTQNRFSWSSEAAG